MYLRFVTRTLKNIYCETWKNLEKGRSRKEEIINVKFNIGRNRVEPLVQKPRDVGSANERERSIALAGRTAEKLRGENEITGRPPAERITRACFACTISLVVPSSNEGREHTSTCNPSPPTFSPRTTGERVLLIYGELYPRTASKALYFLSVFLS